MNQNGSKDDNLTNYSMDIPIVIICYNNYKYVKNMVNNILNINKDLISNIIILNNKSTDENTINYLKTTPCKVIDNHENKGPWICPWNNRHIYDTLPNRFIITDPDLELNSLLPSNFIDILVKLSNEFNCPKLGLALDISDFYKMNDQIYTENKTVYEWEKQFWQKRIDHDEYELYNADIDTTFCVYNKNGIGNNIRIAGIFTAKHLPWYKENKLYTVYENYIQAKKSSSVSTNSKTILKSIQNDYSEIIKNNECI